MDGIDLDLGDVHVGVAWLVGRGHCSTPLET
jgi:hypothetical protein